MYNILNDIEKQNFVKEYVNKYFDFIDKDNLINISKADMLYLYDQLKEGFKVDVEQILFNQYLIKKYLLNYLQEINK